MMVNVLLLCDPDRIPAGLMETFQQQPDLTILHGSGDTDIGAMVEENQPFILVIDEDSAQSMLATGVIDTVNGADHIRIVAFSRAEGTSPFENTSLHIDQVIPLTASEQDIFEAISDQAKHLQASEPAPEQDYLSGVLQRLEQEKSIDTGDEQSSDWVTEPDTAGRFLHLFMAEVDAYASLIFHENQAWAVDGQFPKQDFEQLAQIIRTNWNESSRHDLMKYLRLNSNNRQYALYARSVRAGFVLAVLFDVYMPMNEMRVQTDHLAKRLDLVIFRPHTPAAVKSSGVVEHDGIEFSESVQDPVRVDDLLKLNDELAEESKERAVTSEWLPEIPVSPSIAVMLDGENQPSHAQELDADSTASANTEEFFPAPDARQLFKKLRITQHHEEGEQTEAYTLSEAGVEWVDRLVKVKRRTPTWMSDYLHSAWRQINSAKIPVKVESLETHEVDSLEQLPVQPAASDDTRLITTRPDYQDDTLLPYGIPIALKLPWEKVETPEVDVKTEGSIEQVRFPESLMPTAMSQASLPPGVRHTVTYTFILIPDLTRFRITPEINLDLHDWLRKVSNLYSWSLREIKARPDYLQWIISVPFDVSQGKIVRVVRQFTSEQIIKKHPQFKVGKSQRDFWSPGYLALKGSEGLSQEMVEDFIRQVRERSTNPRRL